VGIFSLFGKKDNQPPTQADRDAARSKRGSTTAQRSGVPTKTDSRSSGTPPQIAQRKVAGKATALKIDAIESEMSTELLKYAPAANTLPAAPNTVVKPSPPPAPPPAQAARSAPTPAPAAETKAEAVPVPSTTTQMLLSEPTYGGGAVALSVSETVPVIEEAAILYANGQMRAAEQMLHQAIEENHLGDAAVTVWNMLFDLYLVTGKRDEFEQLSIAFANKFETSPPTWVDITDQRHTAVAATSSVPVVHFPARLDQGIAKQLERVQNLAASHRTLRLEFVRVTEVDPVGCGILLNVLTRLQKSGNDLVLVGSHELAEKIRGIIEVGRRDETEAPWLLLLELLRLLNLEKEFEEASIDYCVTFEVSPPAFVAPQNKVTTAVDEMPETKAPDDQFAMPRVIEGKTDELVSAIVNHAKDHKPAILDCSRLMRVDFGAAGQLLTSLAPMIGEGMQLELRDVNHLVLALLRIIGFTDLARVVPRKL
jgi:ABC-type transporter Mla MlaB component